MLIVGSSTPTKNSVTWNPKDLARRITSTLLGCDITVSKLKLAKVTRQTSRSSSAFAWAR